MTLLVLSILIMLSYSFSFSAGVTLSAARNAQHALRRESAAESALNYAVALLRADAAAGDYDALDETWAGDGLSVEIEDMVFGVRIVDENRKLNVNQAVLGSGDPAKTLDLKEVLNRLVHAAEGGDADFQALCAWLDKDTPGLHDSLAPKRPLPMIVGLKAIPDLDPVLFDTEEDKPGLDDLLATHPRHINVNTARRELLDGLWEDPDVTARLLERRGREPFRSAVDVRAFLATVLPSDIAKRSEPLLDVKSDFFTISVSPQRDGGAETLTALVKRVGETVSVLYVCRTSEDPVSEEAMP